MSTLSQTASHAGKLIQSFLGKALSSIHAGDEKIASREIHAIPMPIIRLISNTFKNGESIPEANSPQGVNASPDLAWSGVPESARELVLVVEDPDAPMVNPFVHWIVHRIAATTTALPATLPPERALVQLGNAVQGLNDAKTRGYYGPKPPVGHGIHHYHFQLFAVDQPLNLGPDSTIEDLKKAMTGHVVGFGELVGLYERTVETK